MTDSEKLQAILDYAKKELNYARIQLNFVSSMFYDNNDGTYTYDMIDEAQREVRVKNDFFNTVRQIIEEPEEYLKEKAWLEDCVKRILDTKKEKQQ